MGWEISNPLSLVHLPTWTGAIWTGAIVFPLSAFTPNVRSAPAVVLAPNWDFLPNRVLNPADYYKLKVGVGRPPQGIDPADFVLSKFYNDEREEVEFLIEDTVDILNTFLKDKELAIKEASERRIIDVI